MRLILRQIGFKMGTVRFAIIVRARDRPCLFGCATFREIHSSTLKQAFSYSISYEFGPSKQVLYSDYVMSYRSSSKSNL